MKKLKNLGLVLLAIATIAVAVGGMFAMKVLLHDDADTSTSEPVQVETKTDEPEESETPTAEPLLSEETEESEESSEDTEEFSAQTDLEATAERVLATMTLHEKIGQMFVVDFSQLGSSSSTSYSQKIEERLKSYPVGGILFQEENISNASQVSMFISQLQENANVTYFIMAEEEGGEASVLTSGGVPEVADMRDYGDESDLSGAREAASEIAEAMASLGFNMNLAPMADVLTNSENEYLENRSFGTNAELVSMMVSAQVISYQVKGISACVKYFPGSGGAEGNPADGYAETTRTRAEMEADEWHPYTAAIDSGVDCIMMSNIAAPALTGDTTPCSLSETAVSCLRDTLGFDGVIISGSLSEKAITKYYSSSEAALMAINAGVDIIYLPGNLEGTFAAVESAVKNGTISEERIDESVMRIIMVKIMRGYIDAEDYPETESTSESEYDTEYDTEYDSDDEYSEETGSDYDSGEENTGESENGEW